MRMASDWQRKKQNMLCLFLPQIRDEAWETESPSYLVNLFFCVCVSTLYECVWRGCNIPVHICVRAQRVISSPSSKLTVSAVLTDQTRLDQTDYTILSKTLRFSCLYIPALVISTCCHAWLPRQIWGSESGAHAGCVPRAFCLFIISPLSLKFPIPLYLPLNHLFQHPLCIFYSCWKCSEFNSH